MSSRHPAAAGPPLTVFFLSDFGTQDEFVGVVHAVLTAACAGVTVIDLTHQIAAFDVRAGALSLQRAVPYLGPGVVLAVVDPGVGSGRRGICLEVAPVGAAVDRAAVTGPCFFVGPDNGLLIDAAEMVGSGIIARAIELPPAPGPSVTFDGRDLFAPAAAALSVGIPLEDLGGPVDPATLVRLAPSSVSHGLRDDGRRTLQADIVWVDRFGNLQLAATSADGQEAQLPGPGPASTPIEIVVINLVPTGHTHPHAHLHPLRVVETFADLARGQLGLLLDANGHLAVVVGQASAAEALALGAGDAVALSW